MFALFRLKRYGLLICFVVLVIMAIYCIIDEDNNFDVSWLIQLSIAPEAYLIKCYDNVSTSNIINEDSIRKSKSIFFLETSCHNVTFSLNPRQSCAVESAAYLNPSMDVYVLTPSPFETISNQKHLSALSSYPNIKIKHIDVNSYFVGTPLEDWNVGDKLKSSRWPNSHASDVIRYTTLWKYGGYYIDLDVVMLKSFNSSINFVGAESDEDIAAGFLAFTHGHPLIHLAMSDLKTKFKGWDWGNNGPGVITRVLKRYCRVREIYKMTKQKCGGVEVMPPSTFYSIPWKSWKQYFTTKPDEVEKVMASVNDSVAIHVWNHLSAKQPAIIGSSQPYVVLASKVVIEIGYLGKSRRQRLLSTYTDEVTNPKLLKWWEYIRYRPFGYC